MAAEVAIGNFEFEVAELKSELHRLGSAGCRSGAAAESAAAKALLAKLELGGGAGSDVDLSPLKKAAEDNPEDPASHLELGRALAASGQYEPALESLLSSIRCDKTFDENAARRAMLEVFDALGTDHDLAVTYRKQLQMTLFV